MEKSADTAERSGAKEKYLLPVLVKIFVDVVVPTAGYYTLRGLGVAQVLALCLTSVPAVLYFLYRKGRGQRVDAFEVFLLIIIGISNCATLLSANPRVFLSMDGWVSYGIAVACFVSLSTRRPLVYLLIRSLMDNTPLRVKHRTAEWDGLWERDPGFRRPWRVSTMVWGVLNIITGSIRLGIAFLAPVDLAPMLLGFMTLEIVVFTQLWQTWYLRRAFGKRGGFVPPDVPQPRLAILDGPSRPMAAPTPS
jgi:hypothetical protein